MTASLTIPPGASSINDPAFRAYLDQMQRNATIGSTSATTTSAGIVELATDAETNAGTDTERAMTPSNLSSWPGSTNITTVGSISSGTWSASTVAVTVGGTGQTTYTNGQLLIGNTTGNTLTKATLTAGNGMQVTNGTGSITLTVDSASTTTDGIVELATDAEVATGTSTTLVPTVSQQGYVKISSVTASNDATVEFTGLSSTYSAYKIIISNLVPATDVVNFNMRTSTDNGSTYDNGASDYSWATRYTQHTSAGDNSFSADDADSQITTMTNLGSDTNENGAIEITLYNPSNTGYTHATWAGTAILLNGTGYSFNGSGARLSAADVDAIQFLMSSGNIESGIFTLYGIKA